VTFETVAVLLAQETGHQHDAAAPEPSEALFGAYPMTRESTGTSWQPDSAPMEGIHFAAGGFDMMLHNVGVATQVPTFSGFPLGVTSGTYSELFDLTLASSWNPAFITANGGTTAGAEARLTLGLDQGQAYFQHSYELPHRRRDPGIPGTGARAGSHRPHRPWIGSPGRSRAKTAGLS
jgi:hypothetical protein